MYGLWGMRIKEARINEVWLYLISVNIILESRSVRLCYALQEVSLKRSDCHYQKAN